MEIKPQHPKMNGPADWFTGGAWIDPIAEPQEGARATVSAVHFTPCARTAWHAHDLGQTLYVTEGEGRVQSRGEPIVAIRPGDIVHTPSGEWHWHGATPDHFRTHLSIIEGPAEWGEHITDAQYLGELAYPFGSEADRHQCLTKAAAARRCRRETRIL